MHVAIAGNIGSGKTTLTTKLAKHFKWEAHYEDVENNPYLNDFYKEMQRWSFNLQVYFLNSRFRQIIDIKKSSKEFIQDRTIYEDAFIFASAAAAPEEFRLAQYPFASPKYLEHIPVLICVSSSSTSL